VLGFQCLGLIPPIEWSVVQDPKGLAGNRRAGIALTDRLSIGLVTVVSRTQNIVGSAHFLCGSSESSPARWRANGF
jgi:hypothetical protein